MKNIFEIMKEFGLELAEDKKKDFEKNVLDNYKTVSDYEVQSGKLAKAEETIKASDIAVKDLTKQLEGFKDVDVTALNQRIKDLETEKGTIESDYQTKLADRDFSDLAKESIAAVKGKNAKAIMALLDMDALKASKNQKDDMAAALKALSEAEDSKMLFGEPEPNPVGTGSIIGEVRKPSGNSDDAAMRAAMGLPPVTEQK